jgi:hypothetical protein
VCVCSRIHCFETKVAASTLVEAWLSAPVSQCLCSIRMLVIFRLIFGIVVFLLLYGEHRHLSFGAAVICLCVKSQDLFRDPGSTIFGSLFTVGVQGVGVVCWNAIFTSTVLFVRR